MKEFIEPIRVIEIEQPIGKFYIGKMRAGDLLYLANKDLSRYKNVEKGLQRDVSPARVKMIQEYLGRDDATFPNSLIISVGYNEEGTEPFWDFDEQNQTLSIEKTEGSVNVIDGQHRLFGLESVPDFEIPVSIFLGLPWTEQGLIFATINSNQRTVDASLVYELFGMSGKRIEETVAYRLVATLNAEEDSPWYQKIKMLGKAKNDGDISQGAFSKFVHTQLLSKGKVFRNLYLKEQDKIMYKILKDYFSAVQSVFPDAWENAENNYILTKTTGFIGFMKFFIDLARLSKVKQISLTQEYFHHQISKVSDEFEDFTSNNYPSGAIGQDRIRKMLRTSLSSSDIEIISNKKYDFQE